jgi:hypothetical protein
MKGLMSMASTATKSAPALGITNWLEQVRTLAPEARIPYVAIILAEAYERGLSPQQVAEALPKLDRDASWNWCAKMDFDAWVGKPSLSR